MYRQLPSFIPARCVLMTLVASAPALGWSTPVNISNQASGSRAVEPEGAVDSTNKLHVVWAGGQDPASNWRIQYQTYNGSSWSGISTLTSTASNNPDIAIDGDNDLHVAYESNDDIYYIKGTNGSWSSPVNLSNNGPKSIVPTISVNLTGDQIMVAWHDQSGVSGAYDIYARKFSGGAWGSVVNLSNDSTISRNANLAIDGPGNYYVVWEDIDKDEVYLRKHTTGGTWQSEVRLDTSSARSAEPHIAIGSNNHVHVAYIDDGPGDWEVYHRRFDGASWSSPVNVSNHSGVTDAGPSIALDYNNDARIIYHDFTNVYYVKQVAGTWQSSTTMNSGISQSQARIVVDHLDRESIVWQLSTGSNWNVHWSVQGAAYGQLAKDDFSDGDARSDLPLISTGSGWTWWIKTSSSNYSSHVSYNWGSSTYNDVPVSGDYDGDKKADCTVYRPGSQSTWYVLKSSTGYTGYNSYNWGSSSVGDQPVVGDFDGDGKTDIVVWRASQPNWWVLKSSTGFTGHFSIAIGTTGDTPLTGDIDGDGKTDAGVYRPGSTSYFHFKTSGSLSTISLLYAWGSSSVSDFPFEGYVDGDGKSDFGVYRPASQSTWYIKTSRSNFASSVNYQWGSSTLGDVPKTADYDGDGRADISVYRPAASSYFHTLTSSSDFLHIWSNQWGATGQLNPSVASQQPWK